MQYNLNVISANVMNCYHFRGCSNKNIRLMFHKRFPLKYGVSGKNVALQLYEHITIDKKKSKKIGDSWHKK